MSDAVLLLYNSSSHLTDHLQPVIGLSTSSFSLVFELYVQSIERQTTLCSAGAQLILVLCNGKPNQLEFVLHLGINGTENSEIRQVAVGVTRRNIGGVRKRNRSDPSDLLVYLLYIIGAKHSQRFSRPYLDNIQIMTSIYR